MHIIPQAHISWTEVEMFGRCVTYGDELGAYWVNFVASVDNERTSALDG